MPGYNSMGPMGQGPKTGRGWGPCGGEQSVRKNRAGNAFGPGMGRRGGFCRWIWGWQQPPMTSNEEKSYLSDDVKYLKKELKAAQDRLNELEKKDK